MVLTTLIEQIQSQFLQTVTVANLFALVRFVLVIALILLAFLILRRMTLRFAKKKASAQVQLVLKKVFNYTAVVVITMTVFHWLGIDLSGLLGAAGIAGVAIGFAAQTSVSNVISGLFVMTERAFKLGDFIQIDGISGTVESITLLSVRLKTPENQMVRIPNETIIKANMINITYFPLRRFTMTVGVAYGTDLRKLKDVLFDIAAKNEFSVADPVPVVIFDSFADSSISILFGVWGKTAEYPDLKNSLMVEVAERFAAEGISIPFPQITVRSDSDFPEN